MNLLEEVNNLAIELQQRHTNWRWGQCLFNALNELNPKVADDVRATANDPFYNCNIKEFYNYLDKIK